jgi:hypothetical protein
MIRAARHQPVEMTASRNRFARADRAAITRRQWLDEFLFSRRVVGSTRALQIVAVFQIVPAAFARRDPH